MENLQNIANYAVARHFATDHRYGKKEEPYTIHLKLVVATAIRFSHLVPSEELPDIIAACWCHDLIEDCRETYNDVKAQTNERVADIVYALTNEKGKNRKERANDKYYEGIRNTPYATFVKLCDRIANVTYSKNEGDRMFEMYEKENDVFINRLSTDGYSEMIDHLKGLFKREYR